MVLGVSPTLAALLRQPMLAEPFALLSHANMRLPPVVQAHHLSGVPLLMTSLHRSIVERQRALLEKELRVQAEIDSVDSMRELVARGRWVTLMPVSVFKNSSAPAQLVMSEISGLRLYRQMVLATRPENQPSVALGRAQELVEAGCARLPRRGVFGFGVP